MLIESVAIRNFRCLKDVTVNCDDLTAILGRNGSGKSSVFHALELFYEPNAPIAEDDFYNGNTDATIEIAVVFRELNTEEVTAFAPYIEGGQLSVTKKIVCDGGGFAQRYYASSKQIREFAKIRAAGTRTEQRSQWNELVDQELYPGLGPRARSADDGLEAMTQYEQQNPDLAEWIPSEVQFFGAKNVGGGKLDNHTKFVYVPAVRDVKDDLGEKRGTILSQLLEMIVLRRFYARPEVLALNDEFSKRLKEVYDPAQLTEFDYLAAGINRTLRLYAPNSQLSLRVVEPSLPTLPGPATSVTLTEDEYEGSIERKGHGLQRALIFALLQHLAVTNPAEEQVESENGSHHESSSDAGAQPNGDAMPVGSTIGSSGPDLIIAIEEPELYQHPLRAKYLSRILLEMSREQTLGPGGRNQILYSTHSPYFVDLARFDQLRLLSKRKEDGDEIPSTRVAGFSLDRAAREMVRITGLTPGSFSDQSFRARAYPVMTNIINEGFFADTVVLVEGLTEVGVLHAVTKVLEVDWLARGVAVIECGGKANIDRPAVIFRGLEIPVYVVFDGDKKKCHGGRDEGRAANNNHTLLTLCGGAVEDFPKTTVSDRYTCFEDDFETYCKSVVGESEWISLRDDAAEKHGYERPSEGTKNYDVVVSMTETLYREGVRLPVIEEIVERVDALLHC